MDRVKTKLYNSIGNKIVHYLVILTLHLKKLDKVDLIKIYNKFIKKTSYTSYRTKIFGIFIPNNLINLSIAQPNFTI